MKLKCYIVRDLLPLYTDNLCNQETNADIKEHLAECDQCRILADDAAKPINTDFVSSSHPSEKFIKAKKVIRRRIIAGTACGVILFVIIFVFLFIGVIPANPEDILITPEIDNTPYCQYTIDCKCSNIYFNKNDKLTIDKDKNLLLCNGSPVEMKEDKSKYIPASASIFYGELTLHIGNDDSCFREYTDCDYEYDGKSTNLKESLSIYSVLPLCAQKGGMDMSFPINSSSKLLTVKSFGKEITYDLNETFCTGILTEVTK